MMLLSRDHLSQIEERHGANQTLPEDVPDLLCHIQAQDARINGLLQLKGEYQRLRLEHEQLRRRRERETSQETVS